MTNRSKREGGAATGKIIPFPGKRSVPEGNVTRQEEITVSGLAALVAARQSGASENNGENNNADSKNIGKNLGIETQIQAQDRPAPDHVTRQPDGTAAA